MRASSRSTTDAATRTVTGLPREPPHDRTGDEDDASDVERIANEARPVAEEQLLPREAPRLSGDLGGDGSGHLGLLSLVRGGESSRCTRAHFTTTLNPTMSSPTAALRAAAATIPASP